jgi:hypothetical protein
MAQGLHVGQVADHLDPPDDVAVIVAQGSRAHGDQDPASVPARDPHLLVPAGLAVLDASEQEAGLLAVAALEDVPAGPPQHLLERPAGDPLGSPVERGDPSPMIDREDPVGDVVEDQASVTGIDVGARSNRHAHTQIMGELFHFCNISSWIAPIMRRYGASVQDKEIT